jgi:hypothetical protein
MPPPPATSARVTGGTKFKDDRSLSQRLPFGAQVGILVGVVLLVLMGVIFSILAFVKSNHSHSTPESDTRKPNSIKLFEAPQSGNSSLTIKAPYDLPYDTSWTLPNTDGGPNDLLATDGQGNLLWQKQNHVKNNFSATVAPTSEDDETQGYAPGSVWIDTADERTYTCIKATPGQAVWWVTNYSKKTGDRYFSLDVSISSSTSPYKQVSTQVYSVVAKVRFPGTSMFTLGKTIRRVRANLWCTDPASIARIRVVHVAPGEQKILCELESNVMEHTATVLTTGISNIPYDDANLEIQVSLKQGTGNARASWISFDLY